MKSNLLPLKGNRKIGRKNICTIRIWTIYRLSGSRHENVRESRIGGNKMNPHTHIIGISVLEVME